jgi:hypothetical protein
MTIVYILVIVEMIVGTLPSRPLIRLIAMVIPTVCLFFGLQMLILETLCRLNIRAPFRISSIAAGSPLRSGVFYLIEDIIAVDGDGGMAFRIRLNRRYDSSPEFRNMLHCVTLFWAIPAVLVSGGTMGAAYVVSPDIGYVVSIPPKASFTAEPHILIYSSRGRILADSISSYAVGLVCPVCLGRGMDTSHDSHC